MKVDVYGQQIYSESELCDLYMVDPERTVKSVLVDKIVNLSDIIDTATVPNLILYKESTESIEYFDKTLQDKWFIPIEYRSLDIADYVLSLCKNEAELQRAGEELILFQERDMFPLLKYLKYLIDTMRKHNIVWGVGRGSSVASFVLFLLGVHKINSLYYDLSIDEFLK